MKITFLGSGASHGIPVIGCQCSVCLSNDTKDKRLRSSLLVENGSQVIVIDAGPDFRQQMLREQVTRIDAVLLTHEHKDHTAGLDDVRAFNYLMNKAMRIYGEDRVLNSIKQEYAYVFSDNKYPGSPDMDLHPITNKAFSIDGQEIIPIQIYHNRLPVFGYRINNMAYVTDGKTIPEPEIEKLRNLDVLVLSALRVKSHVSHMGLDEVLELIEKVQPKQTYLTHISHKQYNYRDLDKILPEHVHPAYDGLAISL
ncbi:MAG: MBL fold metallo-hydrolase [Salinivirgaceae bacterium]